MIDPTEPTDDVDASASFDDTLSFREAKERAVTTWERWYVQELLARHAGNLTQAARAARMDRAHLRELLQRRGVRKPSG